MAVPSNEAKVVKLALRIEKEYGLPADSSTVQTACSKAIELANDPVFATATLILGVAGDPAREEEPEEVEHPELQKIAAEDVGSLDDIL